jgi:hypothetical protein
MLLLLYLDLLLFSPAFTGLSGTSVTAAHRLLDSAVAAQSFDGAILISDAAMQVCWLEAFVFVQAMHTREWVRRLTVP